MRQVIAPVIFCVGVVAVAIASVGHVGHLRHDPVAIPKSWTDVQVSEFIANSDRIIDSWAGRTVAPGEVIVHDGLPFQKSTPQMVAQRECKWCPTRGVCHKK